MRYAQLVMGPAGCGKSTYCPRVVQHSVDNKMTVEVMNLDPVAEYFDYQPLVDIGKRGGEDCTRWRSWYRHCATSVKVTGSIPDGVIGIFH